MNAQAICDAIDTLFSDTTRDPAETLKDMWTIAYRAGAYGALDDAEDDCDSVA